MAVQLTKSAAAPPTARRAGAAAGTPRAARFAASNQIRVGLALLLLSTAFAVFGPLFAPHSPTTPVGRPYQPPNSIAPLGTDQIGRDVLSRLLYGGRYLIWMAPAAAVLAVVIGSALGMVAAYRGGWVDVLLMRLIDVLLAFPGILLTLLFVAMLGPKPWLLLVLVVLALIPGDARVIRGATRAVTTTEYVQWAQAVGARDRVILLREVLPNITSPVLVELGIRLMWAVGILASMSFIGYGIQPPTADWGLMVSENKTGLATQPLSVLAPVVLIVLYTIAGNLIAEGAARVIARTEGKGPA